MLSFLIERVCRRADFPVFEINSCTGEEQSSRIVEEQAKRYGECKILDKRCRNPVKDKHGKADFSQEGTEIPPDRGGMAAAGEHERTVEEEQEGEEIHEILVQYSNVQTERKNSQFCYGEPYSFPADEIIFC